MLTKKAEFLVRHFHLTLTKRSKGLCGARGSIHHRNFQARSCLALLGMIFSPSYRHGRTPGGRWNRPGGSSTFQSVSAIVRCLVLLQWKFQDILSKTDQQPFVSDGSCSKRFVYLDRVPNSIDIPLRTRSGSSLDNIGSLKTC